MILKDQETLRQEKENINRKFRNLFSSEKIDFETYDSMRKVIIKEIITENESYIFDNEHTESCKTI